MNLKINWKARLRSKSFWTGIIGGAFYIAKESFGWEVNSDIVNIAMTYVPMLMAAIGITADPTTKGIGDSDRALEYGKTYDDDPEEITSGVTGATKEESAATKEADSDELQAK